MIINFSQMKLVSPYQKRIWLKSKMYRTFLIFCIELFWSGIYVFMKIYSQVQFRRFLYYNVYRDQSKKVRDLIVWSGIQV